MNETLKNYKIMFWKRKQGVIIGQSGLLEIPPPPAKKHFETMLEMLRDSEKYYNEGEKEVSRMVLTNPCEFIEKHKERKL